MTKRSQASRTYRAPARDAAVARTRRALLEAGKRQFEERGWAGTTMPAVAADAGVSLKTLEAVFGTKPTLLGAVVDFAIRGDEHALPVARREAVRAMEAAPTAGAMLELHAAQVRRISERSAGIAWVVEQAAAVNADVGELWHRMTANRASGVRWATRTLRAKPDIDSTLRQVEIEATFWLALDWATYRSMTVGRGMSPRGFERWLRGYYRRMLLGGRLCRTPHR